MVERYVTSDLHFGHSFIATKRGFKTVEEHDHMIVERWNATVSPGDKVYVLGDVAWKKKDLETLKKLNGKKSLIMGNHEVLEVKDYIPYFYNISGALVRDDMLLTHFPVYLTQIKGRFIVNIHGHVHDRIAPPRDFYCNVCPEANNLYPVSYDNILEAYREFNKDTLCR